MMRVWTDSSVSSAALSKGAYRVVLSPSRVNHHHDLTALERKRLNGHVETILQKAGRSRDDLLAHVLDALDNSAVPRLTLV